MPWNQKRGTALPPESISHQPDQRQYTGRIVGAISMQCGAGRWHIISKEEVAHKKQAS